MDPKLLIFGALILIGLGGIRFGANVAILVFVVAVAFGLWFFTKGLGGGGK